MLFVGPIVSIDRQEFLELEAKVDLIAASSIAPDMLRELTIFADSRPIAISENSMTSNDRTGAETTLLPSRLNKGTETTLHSSRLNKGTETTLLPSRLNKGTEATLHSSRLNEGTETTLHSSRLNEEAETTFLSSRSNERTETTFKEGIETTLIPSRLECSFIP